MAIVFFAHNGDGLGHLVRASIVADALFACGERPLIVSQGMFPLDDRSEVAGTTIPSLGNASYRVRRSAGRLLQVAASLTVPSVVVEDTHPSPVAVRSPVARALLVRPTAFADLEQLRGEFGDVYHTFILCDAPGSVSWPYTAEETTAILGWERWHVVGPLYRAATAADIEAVRAKYQMHDDRRVCIFSMGGGGKHLPDDRDAETFLALAQRVGDEITRADPAARLLFVKGPYFPPEVQVGAPFEVIEREPLMPALLAAADGAVVRAGFNTPWECISAGTPFMLFAGTTVNEPIAERIASMRARGLVPASVDEFWHDADWRAAYRQTCRTIAAAFPGQPDGRRLRELLVPAGTAAAPFAIPHQVRPQRALAFAMPFVIRVDGVATNEPAFSWLLAVLSERRLRASLEIVPYLCTIEDATLAAFDADRSLFTIGQHGYAGLMYVPEAGNADRQRSEIERGREYLERVFAARWKGGFSAPFDVLPADLRRWWCVDDRAFVSHGVDGNDAGPAGDTIAGIDLWDWRLNAPRSRGRVARDLARQAIVYGYAGLIVHPRTLRTPAGRSALIAVLDLAERRGVQSIGLHELAAFTLRPRAVRARMHDARWSAAIAALGGIG